MKRFHFLTTHQLLYMLRCVVALMLAAHGVIRLYAGTVSGFGEFLETSGFPLGVLLAWGITVFEILGGLILLLGYFRKLICFGFISILAMGIILVHSKIGWFVVGYSTGGAEYSVLLICCLLLIASTKEDKVDT